MDNYHELVAQWTEKDRQARFVEHDLNRAYDEYLAQKAPMPSDLLEKAKRLRQEASELFRKVTVFVNRTAVAA